MFEKATRKKLRFSYKGQISVEDLWDLPLTALDSIYGQLCKEQEAASENSLLKRRTSADSDRTLRLGLVKHVVETKMAEDDARKLRAERKMKKERIAEIIAKKQDESLESMSGEIPT